MRRSSSFLPAQYVIIFPFVRRLNVSVKIFSTGTEWSLAIRRYGTGIARSDTYAEPPSLSLCSCAEYVMATSLSICNTIFALAKKVNKPAVYGLCPLAADAGDSDKSCAGALAGLIRSQTLPISSQTCHRIS